MSGLQIAALIAVVFSLAIGVVGFYMGRDK